MRIRCCLRWLCKGRRWGSVEPQSRNLSGCSFVSALCFEQRARSNNSLRYQRLKLLVIDRPSFDTICVCEKIVWHFIIHRCLRLLIGTCRPKYRYRRSSVIAPEVPQVPPPLSLFRWHFSHFARYLSHSRVVLLEDWCQSLAVLP